MSNVDKSLSESFGVEPIWNPESADFPLAETEKQEVAVSVEAPVPIVVEKTENEEKVIDDDAEFVRLKLLSLLNKGEDAFEYLLHLAKSEDRVNGFEVLNSMLSNMTDMSLKILEIHEKKRKLKGSAKKQSDAVTDETKVVNTTTNNIIFNGTTSELQDLIKKQLGNDDDTIEG